MPKPAPRPRATVRFTVPLAYDATRGGSVADWPVLRWLGRDGQPTDDAAKAQTFTLYTGPRQMERPQILAACHDGAGGIHAWQDWNEGAARLHARLYQTACLNAFGAPSFPESHSDAERAGYQKRLERAWMEGRPLAEGEVKTDADLEADRLRERDRRAYQELQEMILRADLLASWRFLLVTPDDWRDLAERDDVPPETVDAIAHAYSKAKEDHERGKKPPAA